MEFVGEALQRVDIRALAVEMNREQRAEFIALAAAKKRFDSNGIKVKCARIDIRKHRTCSGAHDSAGRGKEAKRCGENLISRLHSRRNQSQPQSIGARGASHGVMRAAEVR